MTWEFTPDEFMHIWSETGQDRYPFPLNLMSSVSRESDYDRLTAELRERLPLGADPDLSAVLRVAADPDSTLTLFGARRDAVRAYGAVVSTVGVTVVQRPGATTESGGNIVLDVGSPALVPKVFCAVLGELPPGSHPPLVESVDRLRDTYERWTGPGPQPADRMRRLLRAPRDGSGHLEVRHGLRGSRPTNPAYLSWFDIRDDGRYLYRRRYQDFHIEPVSHRALHRELTRLLAHPRPEDD